MQPGVQVAPGWHEHVEPHMQTAVQLAPGWHVHGEAHLQAGPQAQEFALLSLASVTDEFE